MDTLKFAHSLHGCEKLLERVHNRLEKSDDQNPIRNLACAAFERARAELASIHDALYWRDEDLPF